ncbi:MAG TPA: hypothetical protein VN905_06135 [Candidatus Binatia bacterium]|nr:hypothetical protein [Candidatus Binatia bacterium]
MSANPAFDALRELLARPPEPLPGDAVLPSGIPALDLALAGGFPRGSIVTLEGPPSSGASALAARLLAQATHEGLGALLQSDGRLSALGLAAAGIRLERLAIVPVEGPLGIVRAADILIRSGTFSVVAIPVPRRVRGIGAAAWNRLSRLAQRTRTVLAVSGIDPPEELCAAAAVRLGLAIGNVRFAGPSGLFGELAGYDIETCVHKHRRAAPGGRATVQCEPFEPRPRWGKDDRSDDLGLGASARNLRR